MFVALAVLAPEPAGAQPAVLPEVLVEGERLSGTDADSTLNPSRVAPSSRASVQVFTARDIEALNPRDVFDLLSHAVGVATMRQGRKVPVHLQIRGDTQFAYLIDGAYLERDSGARVLAALPVSAIESVEVVRDSTALTLGPMVNFASPSGAPNDGFIVIKTRRPRRTGGWAEAMAETEASAVEAGGGAVSGQGSYVAGMARFSDAPGRDDEYEARRNTNGLVKAGLSGAWGSVDLLAYVDRGSFEFQRADPAYSMPALADMKWSFDPIDTTQFSLNGAVRWSTTQDTLVSLYYTELESTFRQGSFVSETVTPHDNVERTGGASLRHSVRYRDTLVQVGGQLIQWRTPTGQLFYEYSPREEEILGGYVQAEQRLFGGALVLDAGYRGDRKKIVQGVDSYGHFSNYANSIIENRTLPWSHFLALGALWRPQVEWTIGARLAQGQQDAGIGVRTEPGTELDAEQQYKQELSVAYDGWGPLARPQLVLFNVRIDNHKYPIRFDPATQQAVFGQTDARRRGLELQLAGAWGATRWHAGWTRLSDQDLVDDHGRTAAENLLVADVAHVWGAWQFNAAVTRVGTYTSTFFSPDGNPRDIGGYTRLDLGVARQWTLAGRVLSVTLYGRNVTDRQYQTQLGYFETGAVWGLSARVDF